MVRAATSGSRAGAWKFARGLAADLGFELADREAAAVERETVGFRVETAVEPLEGGDAPDLARDEFVAGGDAEALRLLVECHLVDEAGKDGAVDPVLAGLGPGGRGGGAVGDGAPPPGVGAGGNPRG